MASSFDKARSWITRGVVEHPDSLSTAMANHFKVTRATASSWLRKLADEGWVTRQGTTRPRFGLGPNRRVLQKYDLPGVEEAILWVRDFAPYIAAPDNVLNICHYGFTEMLNNANDHSDGTKVRVVMRQTESKVVISIADNGVGIFEKISKSLNLPDRRLALLELSKGKFTTDPANHSGEGIFFASRAFDQFLIHANGLQYTHDTDLDHDFLMEIEDSFLHEGTLVQMAISLNSTRNIKEVYEAFCAEPDAFHFSKTVVPVRLARIGNENLISRSQAKRLIQRFEQFRKVVLDFSDVPEIGQAFADELFRVFVNAHPEVELIPIKANNDVQQMIIRGRGL